MAINKGRAIGHLTRTTCKQGLPTLSHVQINKTDIYQRPWLFIWSSHVFVWCWVHHFQIQFLLFVLKVLGGLWEWAIFLWKFSLLVARNVSRSKLSESAGNWAQSSKLRTTELVSVGTTKAVSNWGTPVFNAIIKFFDTHNIGVFYLSRLTLLHDKTEKGKNNIHAVKVCDTQLWSKT